VSRPFNLYAFSDEELLAVMHDNLDSDGLISSAEIADVIGIPDENNRLQGIGIRLGWMVRYGVVGKQPDSIPTRWTITERGRALVEARFSKNLEGQLQKLPPEQLWGLAQHVFSRYGQADNVSAALVRRSFQRAHYRRTH